MKSKFKMYIIIGICIVLVGIIVLLSSYALWRVKEEQTGANVINGACVGFTLTEVEEDNNLIEGFTLDDAWPITDEEGKNLKGYTFTLENTCDKAIDYEIVLESLKTENQNYFDNEYIKVQLDDKEIKRYSELETVDKDQTAEYAGDIRETRHLYSGTISKHVENSEYNNKTHTIRIWISEDSPNSEIGKEFKSKIKVYAGQLQIPPEYKLSDESCFDFNSNTREITSYDINKCGTELILPPTIDGVPIEKIGLNIFNEQYSLLTNVNLENAIYLKELKQQAFWRYVGTGKELVIPNNVTKIGIGAFVQFNGTKLVLSSNLVEMGADAFSGYEGKNQELVIPDSLTVIEEGTFFQFNGSNLILGNHLTTIKYQAFDFYKGIGTTLTIPNSVTEIGMKAFNKFMGTDLILSNNLQKIGSGAFMWYNGSPVTLPSTINSLESWVFYRFKGIININMSEARFNSLDNIAEDWQKANATLIYFGD